LLDKYLRHHDERILFEAKMKEEGRLPPGKSLTLKWPVLHEGEVPAARTFTASRAGARSTTSGKAWRFASCGSARAHPKTEATHAMVLGLRLVVPHLYAWKSCKWVVFMDLSRARADSPSLC